MYITTILDLLKRNGVLLGQNLPNNLQIKDLAWLLTADCAATTDQIKLFPHLQEFDTLFVKSAKIKSPSIGKPILTKNLQPGEQGIAVTDLRKALALVAQALYQPMPQYLLGVTGTNGKSSVVDFVRQILTWNAKPAASIGTVGALTPWGIEDLGMTTPDPITLLPKLKELKTKGIDFVALEASSHGIDQQRLLGLNWHAVGFTNLSQDHFDYHSNMENYKAAKLKLFNELAEPETLAICNRDFSDFYHAINLPKKLSYALDNADLTVTVLDDERYSKFILEGQEFIVENPFVVKFQLENLLCAIGMLRNILPYQDIIKTIPNLKSVKGRLEKFALAGVDIFIDYAHTPDALTKVLQALRPHYQKIILVFGCGGERDSGKRKQMGAIAAKLADIVIVTDDNPRSEDPEQIRQEIIAACPQALNIGDRTLAIKQAFNLAKAKDTIIIAGKGHEANQVTNQGIIRYSDHQVVKELFNQIKPT